MKRNTKKVVVSVLLLCLLFGQLPTTQAVYKAPMFVGIYWLHSTLSISSLGGASCSGEVFLRNGYSADLTVELKQDEHVIKSWTTSGANRFYAGDTYYVIPGHKYTVIASVQVYDGSGAMVLETSSESDEVIY